MNRKAFVIIFISLILICLASTIFIMNCKSGTVARITVDGELFREVDLSRNDTFEIPIDLGERHNIVLVKNGEISMKEASCPDKLCIKQGSISHSGYPIVCLPNKVVIEISGE